MVEAKPNTRIVYGVALASIVESLAFIIWHWWLRNDLINYIMNDTDYWPINIDRRNSAKNMATFMIAVYILRLFLALILFTKTYNTAMAFYIITQLGIVVNLIAGVRGVNFAWTYDIGVATLGVIALHVIYVILLHGEVKRLKAESWVANPHDSRLPEYAPYATPARTPVFVIPAGRNYEIRMNFPQGYPPCTSNNTNAQTSSSPPPRYDAEFGNTQHTPGTVTDKR